MTACAPARRNVCVPWYVAPKWLRDWSAENDGPYEYIARWCDAHGHPGLAASLTKLFQNMRAAVWRRGERNKRTVRFVSAALDPMVRPTKRGCRRKGGRANLRRAHVRLLVAMGLARSGRGWVDFVDVSEALAAQSYGEFLPLISFGQHKRIANLAVNSDTNGQKKRAQPRVYANNRGVGSSRGASGRFCKKPAPAPPERIPTPAFPLPMDGPQAACSASTPPKRTIPRITDVAAARAELARLAADDAPVDPPPKTPRPRRTPTAKPLAPRGSVPPATAPRLNPSLPDDDVPADAMWLRDHFSRAKPLAALNKLSWIGSCRRRGSWRAAVGGLCAMAPGAVRHPAGLVTRLAGAIEAGEVPDPRRRPGYYAHAGWGRATAAFANVADVTVG